MALCARARARCRAAARYPARRTGGGFALMDAILIAVTGLDPKGWEERLRALAPQRDIRLWPERLGDPVDIA